jgi:hypothetical protein
MPAALILFHVISLFCILSGQAQISYTRHTQRRPTHIAHILAIGDLAPPAVSMEAPFPLHFTARSCLVIIYLHILSPISLFFLCISLHYHMSNLFFSIKVGDIAPE